MHSMNGLSRNRIISRSQRYKKGQRVVVLLPDSVRNYMTKFLDTVRLCTAGENVPLLSDSSDPWYGAGRTLLLLQDWMIERGFMEEEIKDKTGTQAWYVVRFVFRCA